MTKRMTPSQLKNFVQQQQRKQQKAIDDYNREVRRVNQSNKQAVDKYNREVTAYNARSRGNRQRLINEINRVNRTNANRKVTVRWTVRQRSVQSLHQTFTRLENSGYEQQSDSAAKLFDLAEAEAANSAAIYNAFTHEEDEQADYAAESLQQTSINDELRNVSTDMDSRWRGALFALSPANPDAARQFCTSTRELFVMMLDHHAPDDLVKADDPNYLKTPRGDVSRRAKIVYCLKRSGRASDEIATFADEDINDVVGLFDELNPATHGEAGKYNLAQLVALKQRAEHSIMFIHEITAC